MNMHQYVISNRGAGQGGGVRNPHTDMDPAVKTQGKGNGHNSKGVPHPNTINKTPWVEAGHSEGDLTAWT